MIPEIHVRFKPFDFLFLGTQQADSHMELPIPSVPPLAGAGAILEEFFEIWLGMSACILRWFHCGDGGEARLFRPRICTITICQFHFKGPFMQYYKIRTLGEDDKTCRTTAKRYIIASLRSQVAELVLPSYQLQIQSSRYMFATP